MAVPQNNNPIELLNKQTQLLNDILLNQSNLNKLNNEFLAKWLDAILDEQRKQTRHLSNISSAATLFIVFTLISVAIGFCIGFMGF